MFTLSISLLLLTAMSARRDGVLNVRGDDVKANVGTSNLQQNSATNFQASLSLVDSNAHGIRHADHTRRRRRTKVGRAAGRGRMRTLRRHPTLNPPIQSTILGFKVCQGGLFGSKKRCLGVKPLPFSLHVMQTPQSPCLYSCTPRLLFLLEVRRCLRLHMSRGRREGG